MTVSLRNYINRNFGTRILSKWIVLCFDIVITIFTYGVAYILRFNFNVNDISFRDFIDNTLLTTGIFALSFLIFRSYDGIIRHSGMADAERLIKAGVSGTIICLCVSLITKNGNFTFSILPVSITLIHVALNISMLAFSRYVIKALFYQSSKNNFSPETILIYGAGRRGVSVLHTLRNDNRKNYHIAGFLDDNAYKVNKTIEGIKIYHSGKLKELISQYNIKELIIGIHSLDNYKKNEIVDICLQHFIDVKYVPPVEDWIDGKLSLKQIRNINIEDLLGREPILIENEKIKNEITNKVILITGAAGSIGSELVKQLIVYKPKKIILVDQAESALYDLRMELYFRLQQFPGIGMEYIICDITNIDRVTQIFQSHYPQIVFHAAAYKHVPLMEVNPIESVHVNVFGSKNLIDGAIHFGVDKFIMISTDKAVNPTNVMGASKRAAEIYVQDRSKDKRSKTIFITTRFGNVLGSNGSVVNYFKKQIESGGPVTITHPEVTRYFMTMSEACKLVLEAATMGKTSEIYLFDMGAPVTIKDLAFKMVLLSGLQPEKDIRFVYTGLRPGEKLHEELLNNNENTLPTHHNKIKIALTTQDDPVKVQIAMTKLWNTMHEGNVNALVLALKEMIPEYISQNSIYEELDKNFRNTMVPYE
ncbi:MAG: polysaccharide biosynthesis protein [Chitinophagales bacterium]